MVSPALRAQVFKSGQKIIIGQSVLLSGAADQIGLAYFNGAKIFFDALNAANGVYGYKIEVKALDDGYDPLRAAGNAKKLISEGVDALLGFVGMASCDVAFAITKPANTLFFAPYAASDPLHNPALANVFHVRPALADEACKVVQHCVTLNQDRIAVFAEDDVMGRAGLAAVNQALVLVSLFNSPAAFIRKMRKAGFGGQFLTFSVVGIDPLFSALGRGIGGIVISRVMPSPRSIAVPIIKEDLDVLNQTDQTPSYESVEGYIAVCSFVEGVRRSLASGGKPDRNGLQKTFASMLDCDVGGFRVNLRTRKYGSVRAIDLVSITLDGKVVR